MKQTLQRFISLLAAAAAAYAGPPLICHRVEIGSAKSLPWRAVTEWDGTAPGYDLSRLTAETLGLLAPGVPLNVRMETLRRAAVYAVKQEEAARPGGGFRSRRQAGGGGVVRRRVLRRGDASNGVREA